jgi:hypothetical protein
MKKLFLILNIIICFMFFSCNKTPVESNESERILIDKAISIPVVYMNNFEVPEDTIGWYGLYPSMFVNEPSPVEGSRSLLIGGGCLQPTAYITFNKSLSGHSYKMNCWGKVGVNGGGLSLTIAENDSIPKPEVHISVINTVWTFYSSDKFYCPEDKTLQLEIFAGGDVSGNIYVDFLSIERSD